MSPDTPDDFSEMTTDELVRLAKSATTARRRHEEAARTSAEKQGALIAELSRRPGWTFMRIGQLLGIDDSSAYRYARQHLKPE